MQLSEDDDQPGSESTISYLTGGVGDGRVSSARKTMNYFNSAKATDQVN